MNCAGDRSSRSSDGFPQGTHRCARGKGRAIAVIDWRVLCAINESGGSLSSMRRSSGKLRLHKGLWHSVKMRAVESNPAKLSMRLDGLSPAGARAAELREPADASQLLPAEAQFL